MTTPPFAVMSAAGRDVADGPMARRAFNFPRIGAGFGPLPSVGFGPRSLHLRAEPSRDESADNGDDGFASHVWFFRSDLAHYPSGMSVGTGSP